jgi:hypothetical protein
MCGNWESTHAVLAGHNAAVAGLQIRRNWHAKIDQQTRTRRTLLRPWLVPSLRNDWAMVPEAGG